jgi:protein ImuB
VLSTAARTLTLVNENSAPSQSEYEFRVRGTLSRINSSREQTWICVYFPSISLDIFRVKEGLPLVVFEEIRGRQIVHSVCDIGLSQGIMSGMPLNAAFVLCRGLEVRLRNPEAEQKELQHRSGLIAHITPTVSLSGCDTILIEVSRSLRLFGGFEAVYQIIHNTFSRKFFDMSEPVPPHSFVMSCSSSPLASTLMAHNGIESGGMETVGMKSDVKLVVPGRHQLKSVLGLICLSDTGLPTSIVEQLGRCGLKTLRDLWRLPRPDLARRFGTGLLDYLDKACGEEHDLRKSLIPATRFFQSIELPMETSNTKLILMAAGRLLGKVEKFLEKRSSGVEKIIFGLCHGERHGQNRIQYGAQSNPLNREITRITVISRQAHGKASQFLSLFTEKLERVDIYSPVSSVSLRIDHVLVCERQTDDIFAYQSGRSDGGRFGDGVREWSQLIDLLAARLGSKMIYCVVAVDDHRPEQAWRYRSPVNGYVGHKKCKEPQRIGKPIPPRPCWLLPEPRKVSNAHLLKNSGLQSHCVERIESGWWQEQDIRRDYSLAKTRYGSRSWIYRDLNEATDGVEEDQAWYMHGLYG